MQLRDKIYGALGVVSKNDVRRYVKTALQRGFDAAKHSRFREGWKTSRNELNQELKSGDWAALNARVWEARTNNPIVAGSIIDNRVNTVGPTGFDYQPMVKLQNGEFDKTTNELLIEKFDEWCDEDYCTITKRMTFRMVQWLVADYLFIDGAYIMRMHITGETVYNNPFGFSLEFLDVADIDFNFNAELTDGTTVVMGIRLDRWRRIISVFFKEKTIYQEINGGYRNSYKRKEIPFDELLYGVDTMHHKIVTGVTPWAPVLIKLKDLDMYTNYHMQNAKWAAGKMGFIKTTAKDAHEYDGPPQSASSSTIETTTDGDETVVIEEIEEGGKYMDIEAGVIEELPFGKDISLFDPKFPSEQFPDFVRAHGREIATGVGGDYASMWGDREGESYSGGRTGEMKVNNVTAYRQALMTDLFLTKFMKQWQRYALLNNALAPLEYVDLKKIRPHYWQGFFRGWIDPLKQAMTDRIKMEDGSQSLNQTITRNGGRLKDVFDDEKYLQQLVKQYGFDIVKKPTANVKVETKTDVEDDSNDDNKKTDEEKRSSGLTIVYK